MSKSCKGLAMELVKCLSETDCVKVSQEAVQGVRGGEGAQHHQRVRRPAGDLLQLQKGPGDELLCDLLRIWR
uniref:Uncharacterized protein n=1 Tax=Aegilops tauschii subsp. strangulata TaxID=200361 RepID=A0A453LCP0_AEGTS